MRGILKSICHYYKMLVLHSYWESALYEFSILICTPLEWSKRLWGQRRQFRTGALKTLFYFTFISRGGAGTISYLLRTSDISVLHASFQNTIFHPILCTFTFQHVHSYIFYGFAVFTPWLSLCAGVHGYFCRNMYVCMYICM